MKENYTYSAILDYSEDGFINISFPDFENLSTCIDIDGDYVKAAQEYLSLVIAGYEDEKRTLPQASKTTAAEKQEIVYINIWMPYHRTTIRETYTKKTLTIPQWLDILAKQRNINFSAILVKGLKKELGIE